MNLLFDDVATSMANGNGNDCAKNHILWELIQQVENKGNGGHGKNLLCFTARVGCRYSLQIVKLMIHGTCIKIGDWRGSRARLAST